MENPAKKSTRAGLAISCPSPSLSRAITPREQAAIDQLTAELESVTAKLVELEEEQGGEDGAFSELDKVNKTSVAARLKEADPTDPSRSGGSDSFANMAATEHRRG